LTLEGGKIRRKFNTPQRPASPNQHMTYSAPIVAALVTLTFIAAILSGRFAMVIQDIPNERSLHAKPTPRTGGIGLIAGLLCGWAVIGNTLWWWLVLPLLVLFAVSLADDMRGLPVRQRLLSQLASAAILVWGSGLFAQQGMLIALLVLLFSVWMTNLFNFMDGSDGLAGGMALFGFGSYGIAAWLTHNPSLAVLNLTIAAAAASFLYYNFHPAKVFMGDAGSIPLGFLVAAMGLLGWQQGSWEPWFPVLVFSPFIVDASVTLLKRTLRGVKVTEAHREHYYQRLIQLGWGHRNVALAEYALMLAASCSALWALQHAFPWQMLLAWSAAYACLMWLVDMRWKNFTRGKNV
jgi:UDP-GlcNAc:undecaprenyl-phosphate GlcNAc-1-phosphate transferase